MLSPPDNAHTIDHVSGVSADERLSAAPIGVRNVVFLSFGQFLAHAPGIAEPAGAMAASQRHGHVRQARARVACVHTTRDRGADDAKTFGKPNQE